MALPFTVLWVFVLGPRDTDPGESGSPNRARPTGGRFRQDSPGDMWAVRAGYVEPPPLTALKSVRVCCYTTCVLMRQLGRALVCVGMADVRVRVRTFFPPGGDITGARAGI